MLQGSKGEHIVKKIWEEAEEVRWRLKIVQELSGKADKGRGYRQVGCMRGGESRLRDFVGQCCSALFCIYFS